MKITNPPPSPFTHFPAFARMALGARFATLAPKARLPGRFGDLRAGAFSREHQVRMKRVDDEAKRRWLTRISKSRIRDEARAPKPSWEFLKNSINIDKFTWFFDKFPTNKSPENETDP